MKNLNKRTSRIAGLLALALGAVALLAVSGVAVAKDHGRDHGGRHDDNGRHHEHHSDGRHHNRHFEMRESGTITSFDASTGKLTIALLDSGTVTGLVTDSTEIKCEGVDDRLDRRDNGGDNSGPGSGDDNGGDNGGDNSGRGSGDDNGGHSEPGDDNGGRGEPEPGDDHGGEVPPVGTPAPEGEASCSVASLVPGALVGEAKLRLEGGSSVFEEIELGHHS
jgi:hypothetical protein